MLPDTIQYLRERAADETKWLEALSKKDINTTLVWGLHDNVVARSSRQLRLGRRS